MTKILIRCGNFFFHYRDFLFPFIFLSLALLIKPIRFESDPRLDYYMDAAGLAVAVAGQALRAVVIGLAYVKRGGKNKHIYADDLVQEGIFAHSRNPLYVGNLMVLAGLIVIHGAPLFIAIGGAFYFFAYITITLAEEEFLGAKFGDKYREYCQRVPRFIPRLKGIRQSTSGMSFDWQRVLRKEYGSTFTWILCAMLTFVWEKYHYDGLDAALPRMYGVAIALPVMLVCYFAVRFLKKAKRLGRD
ncbi:MAG: isoprenylcysteine carboxylmethyltransferase family protein [Candidatus Hydrogenedentota bacterium]